MLKRIVLLTALLCLALFAWGCDTQEPAAPPPEPEIIDEPLDAEAEIIDEPPEAEIIDEPSEAEPVVKIDANGIQPEQLPELEAYGPLSEISSRYYKRYGSLGYYSIPEVFEYDSRSGMYSGILDKDGTPLLRMATDEGWFISTKNWDTGERMAIVYFTRNDGSGLRSSKLINLDTGEETEVITGGSYIEILWNGWFYWFTEGEDGELIIQNWDEEDKRYGFSVGANDIWLSDPELRIAAIG